MSCPMVRVEGLWKKFGLTVNDSLRYGLIDSGRRLLGAEKDSERLRRGEFWALQDVNFELHRGEALGVLGINGSGKTTLLRILNGAFSPDRGRVEFRGRIGALIAAGAGFSPLLTGRENIYVSGSLLGLSSAELDDKFDEIVEFSGLGEFIDMPVRNYSSGMAVRLGFAIAVLGEPDVLLVDEVLAVGDVGFQKRCFEKIHKTLASGTAIIFVSHSVGSIWAVCTKGLFLDKGISSGIVSVEDACRRYELANYRATDTHPTNALEAQHTSDQIASFMEFQMCNPSTGAPLAEFEGRQDIGLKMTFKLTEEIPDLIVRYSIDAVHYRFIATSDSSFSEGIGVSRFSQGVHQVTTILSAPRFRPGIYYVNIALCRKSVGVHLCTQNRAASFIVRPYTDRFHYDVDSPAVMDLDATYVVDR